MLHRLKRNPIFYVSLLLLGLSAFFFVESQKTLQARYEAATTQFKTGTSITVVGVVADDEVRVRNEAGQHIVVRLMGIKNFAAMARLRHRDTTARAAKAYLEQFALGRTGTLTIETNKTIKKGIVLAYIDLDAIDSNPKIDLGAGLIDKGLAVVFNKNAFGREVDYLAREKQAREGQLGLWGELPRSPVLDKLRLKWASDRARSEVGQP